MNMHYLLVFRPKHLTNVQIHKTNSKLEIKSNKNKRKNMGKNGPQNDDLLS